MLLATAVCVAAPAPAQTGETTTRTDTTVTDTGATETTAPSDEEEAAADDDEDNRWLAVAVLLFGAGVVVAFLVYLRWAQDKYFGFVRTAMRRGLTIPQAEPVSAIAAGFAVQPAKPLQIKGDAMVVVGEKAEFKAVAADGTTPIEATWSVPQDTATLESEGQNGHTVGGESVRLTALRAGVFLLSAEADGDSDEVSLTSIVAPAEAPKLPFVGSGYGAIIVAVAILTIAGVLSLAGKLASEAVATLFGALAGYIFLKGATGDETSSSSED